MDSDSSFDSQLYCLSVSWRCDGVNRLTSYQALSPPLPLKPRLTGCNLVVPSNNNVIDFALQGQAMTFKLPSFVRAVRLKITSRCSRLNCPPGRADRILEVRGRWWGDEFTENPWEVFLSINLVSGCRWWSIFGGEKGPLLYFGFLVARLLSPRSPITQFELTLPVQGEPWPGATHCYNSSNTMKSNITLSLHAVTHTRTHACTFTHLHTWSLSANSVHF